MISDFTELVADLPHGPLDKYRKSASFCWKKMKVFYEGGDDLFRFKYRILKALEKDKLFHRPPNSFLSVQEQREIATNQINALFRYNFLDESETLGNPLKIQKWSEVLSQFDIAMNARLGLSSLVFSNSVLALGTDRHLKYYDQARNKEIFGAFCLTEIAHGSNTKGMGTVATYDAKTEEFIINTPKPEDMKCWVGNLGHSATHGLVYAQLITPDGVKQGLHGFIVPLRNPRTMIPYRGVIVGDMGPKIGFNSIDNGFCGFDHVRIPRENLLNRSADVSPEGKYVTSAKSSSERQGLVLGSLSNARVGILVFSPAALAMSLTIAVRYSAVRCQFSVVEGGPEVPVIEHPLQRWRLFPYVAATYLLQHLAYSVFADLAMFHTGILMGDKSEEQNDTGKELHAISCATKAVSGFIMRDGLQECREACGGHGYLWVNQLGRIRSDFEPVITYEGDNNVILFQTSNFLLAANEEYKVTSKVRSPLKSLQFLTEHEFNFTIDCAKDWLSVEKILSVYKWLVRRRLRRAVDAIAKSTANGQTVSSAKARLAATHLHPLSIAFTDMVILQRYYDEVLQGHDDRLNCVAPESLKIVLSDLFVVFGLWRLQQHAVMLIEENLLLNCTTGTIQEALALLCDKLKPEIIGLVDAFAVPDYVLASPIGFSDGYAYRNMIQAMLREPGCFDRPHYWEQLAPHRADLSDGSSKL